MASVNHEKRNLLKAHRVSRDNLRRACYVIREIQKQLLDSTLGPNSCEDGDPLNTQRKEEEEYLNVFLNQEDFGSEILHNFKTLISQLSTSTGANLLAQANSGQVSQNSNESDSTGMKVSITGAHSSQSAQSTQKIVSRKRIHGTSNDLPGTSAKNQKMSESSDSEDEAEEAEFTLPPTPQPPGNATPRHTKLSSAACTIATNDRCGAWLDSNSTGD